MILPWIRRGKTSRVDSLVTPASFSMSKKLIASLTGSVMLAGLVCLPVSAADEEKMPSIKDVMKKVMKGKPNFLAKVVKEGSEAEKKELHKYLVALSKNTPKKGGEESWKKLTTALVEASTELVDGKEGAGAKLMKASNCKSCHSEHK
jgi:hypothetical protein